MIRVLLVADTHLGFDLPARPRVERRRRGPDFFANLERALAPARRGEVDLVVHGGDLLYRSKVPPSLVQRALEPLLDLADRGVPVVLVPGNHERSALPCSLLAAHAHLHLLDRPRTIRLTLGGETVAVAGFPCERERVRGRFAALVGAADDRMPARVRLLAVHQAFEGARVGPSGFTFRDGHDVVRGCDVPPGFAAVLAGHVHRHQVLTRDLAGRPLAAPVLYPGSVERTSFAERDEAKGYLTLELAPGPGGGRLAGWRFHRLPARPMRVVEIAGDAPGTAELEHRVGAALAALEPDAVVQLRLTGRGPALPAAALRRLAPPTQTVTVAWGPPRGSGPARHHDTEPSR